MTLYMYWATVSFCIMTAGLILKKRRTVHVYLMNIAIALDLSLVLLLEILRAAVETAISFSLEPLQQLHILFSTLATVGYFPVLYLGWGLWRGRGTPSSRLWHQRIGIVTFICRSLGFIMMFSLLK